MITQRYTYTPCPRDESSGTRLYVLPDGQRVPSVTTILSKTEPAEKKIALANWRKAVGHDRAQAITTQAANRGTRMHKYLENFILTDDLCDIPSNPFAHPSWYMAAKVILNGLNNVDEFWATEAPLYYPGLYAGTTDCVGVWKGRPSIIDFKQTNQPKSWEKIDDYKIQLCAYAQAHNFIHGTDIQNGVIMMCVQAKVAPDGTVDHDPQYQEFVLEGAEFEHFTTKWMERVEQFYQLA